MSECMNRKCPNAKEIERLEQRHTNFLKEFYATNAENSALNLRIAKLEAFVTEVAEDIDDRASPGLIEQALKLLEAI